MVDDNIGPGPAWGFGAIAPAKAKTAPVQAKPPPSTMTQQLVPKPTAKPQLLQPKPLAPSAPRHLGVWEKDKLKPSGTVPLLPAGAGQPPSDGQNKPKVGQPTALPEPSPEPQPAQTPGKSLGMERIKNPTEGARSSRLLGEATKSMESVKISPTQEKLAVKQSTPVVSLRPESRLLAEANKSGAQSVIHTQPAVTSATSFGSPRTERACAEASEKPITAVGVNPAAEAAKRRWLATQQKNVNETSKPTHELPSAEIEPVKRENTTKEYQTKKAVEAFKLKKAAEEATKDKATEDAKAIEKAKIEKAASDKAEKLRILEEARKAKAKAAETAKYRKAFEMAEKMKAFEAAAKKKAALEQLQNEKVSLEMEHKDQDLANADEKKLTQPTTQQSSPKQIAIEPHETQALKKLEPSLPVNGYIKPDAVVTKPVVCDGPPRPMADAAPVADGAEKKSQPRFVLSDPEVVYLPDEDVEQVSDIVVPLRPEGVCAPADPNGDTPDEPSPRLVRINFKDEVVTRQFIKGSVPNAHFSKSLSKQTVVPATSRERTTSSTPAIRPILRLRPTNDTSSNTAPPPPAVSRVVSYLENCEEELKILERSLPTESTDPESIGYTRESIAAARHAIVEARFGEGRDEDTVYAAFDRTKQARDFHEETLRRVNGRTHFEQFKHAVASRIQSDQKAWQYNAGRAPEDFFDEVLDEEDGAET